MEADGAQQPFQNSSFDLIVSNLGINNWDAPQVVLAECFRVAKKGAAIALTTNIKGHYREFYDLFRETLTQMNKTEALERLRVNEDHRGTKESTCELLRGSGFKVVKLVEDSFQIRFLDGSTLFRHSLTRIGFLDGWRSVVGSEEEDEIFAVLEQRLNEVARRRGELSMTVPMLYLEGEK
jgi:SAM-dependent methyltransferase